MTEIARWIERYQARIRDSVVQKHSLSLGDLWGTHGSPVWKAKRFTSDVTFYPVYTDGENYSYSVLALILFKGQIHLNTRFAEYWENGDKRWYSGDSAIDYDIRRIGGPGRPGKRIASVDEYVEDLAKAMVQDIAAVEARHPNTTNVVLCGGKDSLNLLLLPWKNDVIAASGPPNFDLVTQFVKENRLDIRVIPLDDGEEESIVQQEILINACRTDLAHARWGPHLKRIAEKAKSEVIFWKGQLFGSYSTMRWKKYARHSDSRSPALSRLYSSRVGHRLPHPIRRKFESAWLVPHLRLAMWFRGAMWQGCHTAIVRELTDSLVLSAYHGPMTSRVLNSVDLAYAVEGDIRPSLGRCLHGQSVRYPSENPSPPESTFRTGLHRPQHFIAALKSAGFPVLAPQDLR